MENNQVNGVITTTSTGKRWNFCPECGMKLEPTWKHCPGCGAVIGETQAAPFIIYQPMPNYATPVCPTQQWPNTGSPLQWDIRTP